MTVVRAFIAIELGEDIHRHLDKVIAPMARALAGKPLRWVPVENIHLTLKFLGDVSVANLEMIYKLVGQEAAHCFPFEIGVGGIGAFPNEARPRVLWVGVKAPDELGQLQKRIENEVARFGYPPDRKPFQAHLTLGRVSRNASPADVRDVGETLRKQNLGYLGATRVEAVQVFRSDLQPSGAVYTPLFSAPFGEGG
jgi:2'-5' RNA ligase